MYVIVGLGRRLEGGRVGGIGLFRYGSHHRPPGVRRSHGRGARSGSAASDRRCAVLVCGVALYLEGGDACPRPAE